MSYIIVPSGGVSNPLTANLDAGMFDIETVDTLSADAVVGTTTVSGGTLIAGTEIAHTNPAGTLGFFGVPPVFQQAVAFPIVATDPVVEDTINQICLALQQLGLIV